MAAHIIIGGGLAGSFLSAYLIDAGESVIMVDAGSDNCASSVAAGLFNTVTGLRAAKTWQAETLISQLLAFFDRPLFTPLQKWLHRVQLYRPFQTVYEQNEWSYRENTPEFHFIKYIREIQSGIDNPLGGILVTNAGWLDINPFRQHLWEILSGTGAFKRISEKLDYQDIQASEKYIWIQERKLCYQTLTFCEGISGINNPYFPEVSLIPLKGEILRVKSNQFLWDKRLISNHYFVVPQNNHEYVVGATYDRDYKKISPTEVAAQKMLDFLKTLTPRVTDWQIIHHLSGLRPTTKDRRPILAKHFTFQELYYLNGLGTKGVLLAPQYAASLVDWILNDRKPALEVSIDRFI